MDRHPCSFKVKLFRSWSLCYFSSLNLLSFLPLNSQSEAAILFSNPNSFFFPPSVHWKPDNMELSRREAPLYVRTPFVRLLVWGGCIDKSILLNEAFLAYVSPEFLTPHMVSFLSPCTRLAAGCSGWLSRALSAGRTGPRSSRCN